MEISMEFTCNRGFVSISVESVPQFWGRVLAMLLTSFGSLNIMTLPLKPPTASNRLCTLSWSCQIKTQLRLVVFFLSRCPSCKRR